MLGASRCGMNTDAYRDTFVTQCFDAEDEVVYGHLVRDANGLWTHEQLPAAPDEEIAEPSWILSDGSVIW